jgi:hypothetical protein
MCAKYSFAGGPLNYISKVEDDNQFRRVANIYGG